MSKAAGMCNNWWYSVLCVESALQSPPHGIFRALEIVDHQPPLVADKGAIESAGRRKDYHIMCGIAAVYDAAKIDGMKTSSQVARNFQTGSIAWAFVVNAAMVAGE